MIDKSHVLNKDSNMKAKNEKIVIQKIVEGL